MELGRPYTPIATLLPGYDVEVIVRHLLTAVDAVILERKNPKRLESSE